MKSPGTAGVLSKGPQTQKPTRNRAGLAGTFSRSMEGKDEPGRLNAAAPPSDGVQLYDPHTIRRSPFNRKIDTKCPEFRNFVADVKEVGVLQNGIIRPVRPPEGKIAWELIAGERRWTAAIEAGVQFPAAVRDVADVEALEMQARENTKREDLNAMDEAEKFAQLQDHYERDLKISRTAAMARIKEVTGMGESTIYQRMTLMTLPPALQQKIRDGVLPSSHGELIAKIEHPEVQMELSKQILKPDQWDANEQGILNYKRAKQAAENAVRHEKNLKAFELEKQKVRPIRLAAVLDQKASDRARGSSDYCRLESRAPEFCISWKDDHTWKKLTKGKELPAPTLMHDHDGAPLIMFPRAEMIALAKANGYKPASGSSGGGRGGGGTSHAKAQAAHRARTKAFVGLLGNVAAAAEHMDGPEYMRFIFEGIIRFGGRESVQRVVKRRKIEVPAKYKYDQAGALAEGMKTANGRELRGVIAELIFQRFSPSTYSGSWDKSFAAACKLFGVEVPPWSAAKLKKAGSQASGDDEEEGD